MNRRKNGLAIIGYACRFPGGADTPGRFWDLLVTGRDAVTEIPDERWDKTLFQHPDPREPGRAYTFRAGVLDDVASFDCGFFGISPREAAQMDPQQRLLLELTWEALERGGIVPDRLAGARCSVHVGISSTDYADIRQGDTSTANGFFMTGSTLSIAANRISYLLDLRGPSVALDTACSSALFALDDAWRTIHEGRADMAIVGAVSLLLSPYPFIGFSKATMLSPYGQCRAFDETAEGYVRGEGGGVLMVKRLADAERDGDTIFALVRGVETNSDGRTMGIAQPSAASQEELLRAVYRKARVRLRDIAYVEAHGTGTAIGDPVEAASVGRAIAARRPRATPLYLGSAKANIGHLEPASGMAGLIKAIEVLRHGAIPPSIHADRLNPAIDFEALNLRVARDAMALPGTGAPPVVGVNSFGFGGTNAHAILQAWRPAEAARPPVEPDAAPLLLSARSEPALRAVADGIADYLDAHPGCPVIDVARTLALHRARHAFRAVARGRDRAALVARLRAIAAAEPASGRAEFAAGNVGFVFSGNGAQWAGMGLRLLDGDPVFRATIEAIDALTRDKCGLSVIAELRAGEEESRLSEAPVAQPLIFAVQAATADSLMARGLIPSAVAGHSVGEVAAAYAAGALTLDQAVEVIVRRSAVQERTRGMGGMAAAELDADRARQVIAPFDGRIELAAVNAPESVTLTGEFAALRDLAARLPDRRTAYTVLDFDYPFHSRHLDPHRADALDGLAGLRPSAEAVPFYSTVDGARRAGAALDAAYWWENMRRPVRFADAVAAMAADGCALFVEISAHPIMQAYVRRTLRGIDAHGRPLPTLRRGRDGPVALDAAVDAAFEAGAALDARRLFPGAGPRVELPTYPWQRERCWIDPGPDATGQIYQRSAGALLGARFASDLPLWQGQIDEALHPFLADHVVGDAVLFPATGFAELALEAALAVRGDGPVVIEALELRRPMALDPARRKLVRLTLTEDGRIDIAARTRLTEEPWSHYAVARLSNDPASLRRTPAPPVGQRPTAVWRGDEHYPFAARIGLRYGPAFRTVDRVELQSDGAARVILTAPGTAGDPGRFALHPALFDGCLQGLIGLLRATASDRPPRAYLPTRIERLILLRPGATPALCDIRVDSATESSVIADFTLRDADGVVIAQARSFRFERAWALERDTGAGGVYGFETVPLPPAGDAPALAAPTLEPGTGGGDLGAALDGLAGLFAAAALRELESGAAGGAVDERAPLLESCLTLAIETGAYDPDDPAAGALGEAALHERWRAFLAARPEALAEATAIGRAGLRLADLLRGADPASALPGVATLERLHGDAPTVGSACAAVRAAVARAVDAAPAHRRVRIVELGGGVLAGRLLRDLPRDRVACTVVSIAGATAPVGIALPLDPALDRATVDPARPLGPDNGLGPRSADLVIGVLGVCTPPLDAAAAAMVRDLLAPGGAVLLAAPRPAAWLDIAFGAAPGWWRRDGADGGVRGGLPDVEAWRSVLAEAAFEDVAVGEAGAALAVSARAPARGPELRADEATVLLIADPPGTDGAAFADALAEALRRRGAAPSMTGLDAVGDRLDEAPQRVVFLRGIEPAPDAPAAMLDRVEALCNEAVQVARGLARPDIGTPPSLALVLAADAGPLHAPLRGLGRVIQNEHAGLRARIVEVDGDPVAAVETLADEILFGDGEDEVMIAPGRRQGRRLRAQRAPSPAGVPAGDGHRALVFTPGRLDTLRWSRVADAPLPPGAVEIAVRAAGLNFRDVMFAMGLLPVEAVEGGFAGATLGLEAAGEIVAVGAEVDRFKAGDRVFCFAPQCFAERVVVDARAVCPIPAALGMADAATVPTVFFTAWYALTRLARLEQGERILVHGAAGGIGLAAIQIARHLGAEIYATAGTPEKRDVVRLMGVAASNIFGSREDNFDAGLMEATGGAGVDVVLNSLSGEAIRKGLQCLRPFGRFIELGKRDYYRDTAVGLRPFRNNVSYFGVDADQIMAERPALASDLLAELVALFDRGALRALPRRVFRARDIADAFRHMQHSQHIGKIVISLDGDAADAESAEPAPQASFHVDPAGCHLVAGGTRGFGLATAAWLAAQGARDIVLLSRAGRVADADRATLAAMRRDGARVEEVACDLTDAAALDALFERLDADGRPVRGVVHAAAVYDDALLAAMSPDRLRRVLAPKIAGGWALHRATEARALDYFVLYSSVATLFGNPGQGAYVAANAFLEALAAHRRARGLPATAIGWGAIADAGYLTRARDVREAMETRFGIVAVTAEEALRRLPDLVARDGPAAAVIGFDPGALIHRLPAAGAAKFGELAGRRGAAGDAAAALDIDRLLAEASPGAVKDLLAELLTAEIGQVLRLAPERIDPRRPIVDLGMDSLMGLELMTGLEERLGVRLPAMPLGEDSSVVALADRIYGFLAGGGDEEIHSGFGAEEVTDLLSRHAEGQSGHDVEEIVGDLNAPVPERSGSAGDIEKGNVGPVARGKA